MENSVYLSSRQTTGYDLKTALLKISEATPWFRRCENTNMSFPFLTNVHLSVPEEPQIATVLMRMFFMKSSLYLPHTSRWQLRINSKCKHLRPKANYQCSVNKSVICLILFWWGMLGVWFFVCLGVLVGGVVGWVFWGGFVFSFNFVLFWFTFMGFFFLKIHQQNNL